MKQQPSGLLFLLLYYFHGSVILFAGYADATNGRLGVVVVMGRFHV